MSAMGTSQVWMFFSDCPHRAITGPVAEIKKLRPKVKEIVGGLALYEWKRYDLDTSFSDPSLWTF